MNPGKHFSTSPKVFRLRQCARNIGIFAPSHFIGCGTGTPLFCRRIFAPWARRAYCTTTNCRSRTENSP